jgi:hypothetical protein
MAFMGAHRVADELKPRRVGPGRSGSGRTTWWDPEVEAHMREVGERMKREGRLTVKKNERAGF